MVKECAGGDVTEATDAIIEQTIEQMSIAKGRGLITEQQYDEAVEQANKIREANERLKCILDNIPEEVVSPESIVEKVTEEMDEVNTA